MTKIATTAPAIITQITDLSNLAFKVHAGLLDTADLLSKDSQQYLIIDLVDSIKYASEAIKVLTNANNIG